MFFWPLEGGLLPVDEEGLAHSGFAEYCHQEMAGSTDSQGLCAHWSAGQPKARSWSSSMALAETLGRDLRQHTIKRSLDRPLKDLFCPMHLIKQMICSARSHQPPTKRRISMTRQPSKTDPSKSALFHPNTSSRTSC